MDESLLRCSRASSPFVSEIASRCPSKQYEQPDNASVGHLDSSLDALVDDKENRPLDVLQSKASAQKLLNTDSMPPPPLRTPRQSPSKHSSRSTKHSSPVASDTVQKSLDLQLRSDAVDDDTCFSTFSEVREITEATRASASKRLDALLNRSPNATPRTTRKRTSSRSPSPTPLRRVKSPMGNNTQSFLIDFTQQIEDLGQPGRLPISRTEPNLLQHLNRQRSPGKYRQSLATTTPGKQSNILNLLDFELPPAPTPRSIPTITVRELETLKSQYLSQISSLKATLSGREAEVESLKRAVADAERRVGDAQQAAKEEKVRREHAEQERMDWERRGMEVENLLNTVREEVLKSESERDELVTKLDDYERRLDETEQRAAKAEEGLTRALAVRGSSSSSDGESQKLLDEQVQGLVATQIDTKIEAVSRELHAVYKEKHERKVATLKKSYEARSEKRCAEMQVKLAELQRLNQDLLQRQQEAGHTSVSQHDDADVRAEVEQGKAHVARLKEELAASRSQRSELVRALEQERIEKGDLVAAVDEMLALQADQGPTQAALSVVEDFRRSISRPPTSSAGLRRPSESRIAKLPTLRTPAGNKSKMLANIERMGRSAAIE